MVKDSTPKTLQSAIKYFSEDLLCVNFIASLRWENGIAICPRCQNNQTSFLSTRKIWKCKNCKKQFSVKVGTIFEDSPIGLDKWLCAIWMITNCKNGVSSYEIHRAIGITQKSAWFMLHRIRLAMDSGSIKKLSGEVEADETFIGGKAKNMHKWKRELKITGRGSVGKTAVMGILERQGKVSAKVITDLTKETLHGEIKKHVEQGANLFTDQWTSYQGLADKYIHEVVNHGIFEYVRGNVHTNGIENFWALLKRTLSGTYVSVEAFHLGRYVVEQTFRFNERKENDRDRFLKVIGGVTGKRITYEELIGYCPRHF